MKKPLTLLACAWILFAATAAQGQGTWSTALLSLARDDISATSVGDYAIFAGGWVHSSENSGVVDIFSGSTGQWSTAALSQPRIDIAATSVGGYALFAGGSLGVYLPGAQPLPFSTVDLFNAGTGQWSTASLSKARTTSVAAVGSYALFGGGYALGIGSCDTVDVFNAASGQWSTTCLSQARQAVAATSVGNYAVFAGGACNGNIMSDRVDMFNSAAGLWTTACLSQARCGAAATSVGNYAIFAGGAVTSSDLSMITSNVVDIFNAATGLWSTASLSVRRQSIGATTLGNYAIFAGGFTTCHGHVETVAAVDIFDASTGLWSTAALPFSSERLAATTLGQSAFFCGGYNLDTGSSDRVDILTIPEPATLSLLALGGAAVAARRRRSAARGGRSSPKHEAVRARRGSGG